METADHFISIIIVGWNHWFTLENCLHSIYKQKHKNFEVIYIDNASTDCSVLNISKRFPYVKIILNPKNNGFAKACNQGISIARGQFVFILNPDTELEYDAVGNLIKTISVNATIGICSPKILHFDNPKIINSIGMTFNKRGRQYHIGDGEFDNGKYSLEREVFMVAGAAMFCRKKMLDEIGGFDELFFAYGEDSELSLRAWWNGWRCVYNPESVIYHVRNSAAKKYPEYYAIARYYEARNRYWNIITYFPRRKLFPVMPYIMKDIGYSSLKSIYRMIRFREKPIILQAHFNTIQHLGRLLGKRLGNSKISRMPSKKIDELLNV